MPDLERVFDNLREHIHADDPEKLAYEKGFTAGKNKARKEVAILTGCIALITVLSVIEFCL